jgi:murein peptide amidase A
MVSVVRLLVSVAGYLALAILLTTPAPANLVRQERLLGYSVLHRPITDVQLGSGPSVILILGGMDGDEPSGSYVVERLAAALDQHLQLAAAAEVVLVPRVNPDGLARNARTNADGVDINRNFPTYDWGRDVRGPRYSPGRGAASEPETRIVIRLIAELHPCRIISVHAPFHEINIDGPALPLARVMQEFNHYRITTYIGYPTPGSLGTYAGKQLHIPTIDLELPPVSDAVAWGQNKDALLAAIKLPCG